MTKRAIGIKEISIGIKEIYVRRQKAYDKLLACDIELDKILQFILSSKEAGRREVLDYLAQHGHGGGNFRRIISQLREE